MAQHINSLLKFLAVAVLLVSYPIQADSDSAAKKCKAKIFNNFLNRCNVQGRVQNPFVLKKFNQIETYDSCGATCLSRGGCKSFRYIQESQKCILYTKYLEDPDMEFTTDSPDNSTYSDNSCFTDDCHVQSACNAFKNCPKRLVYDDPYSMGAGVFSKFFCAYGKTIRISKHFDDTGSYNGKKDPCDVLEQCLNEYPPHGPFNVFYHIPSKSWICNTFFYGYKHYGNRTYQHVDSSSLTPFNSTVGASYAYWWSAIRYG